MRAGSDDGDTPRLRRIPADRGSGVRLALAGHRGGFGANLGLSVGDDAALVAERRAAVARDLGVRRVAWLDQRHGRALVAGTAVASSPRPVAADACFTDAPDLACAVLVADCVPVLFWSADGRRCGAVHAGWRGLVAGVLGHVTACVPPGEARAWVGPAIGPCCFEVGEEVVEALGVHAERFGSAFRHRMLTVHVRRGGPRPHVALGEWVRDELLELGVRRVHGWGRCTRCDRAGFPSHRRGVAEGSTQGRMAALVAPAVREASAARV